MTSLVSRDAMLDAACARTGFDDFGPDDFHEGFDLLCADISRLCLPPAQATATGARIGAFLDARLYAHEGFRKRSECLKTLIERPLIIAGLVRSGTTALHKLLSLDPQFQGPEHWLTAAPMTRPPRGKWADVPEYRQIAAALAVYVGQAPEMLDDHMMAADEVEESLFILAQTFSSNMYPSMWDIPAYDDWYRSRDDTPSYLYLADVLRLIGADEPGRRWLLKNPTDLYSLGDVLTAFPDAMIVQTHRDPVDAIPSISSLIYAARKVFMGEKADPQAVGRREAAFWSAALDRAARARRRAQGQVFDVEFEEFAADQMATVRALYAHFGLTLSRDVEAAMEAWLAAHPRRNRAGPRYAPEDFGLTADRLRDVFAGYRAARAYQGA